MHGGPWRGACRLDVNTAVEHTHTGLWQTTQQVSGLCPSSTDTRIKTNQISKRRAGGPKRRGGGRLLLPFRRPWHALTRGA